MKKLHIIAMLLILLGACSKDSTPEPIVPAGNTTASLTCLQSTWKYEVILGTPVPPGTFRILYRDEFNNEITDTSLTSIWTKEFVFQFETQPVGVVAPSIIIGAGAQGTAASIIAPLTNTIMVSIYKNGQVVETTGIPLNYCLDNTGGGNSCAPTTIMSITKNHICNN